MRLFFKKIYDFAISLRCAILIIILIAISSIMGTMFPQGMPDEAILSQYGPESIKARLIILFGINDLYHSLWFQALLVILTINVVLCTVERFPKTLKLWSHTESDLSPDRLLKFSLATKIRSSYDFKQTVRTVQDSLTKRFKAVPTVVLDNGSQWSGVVQKGKASLFMVYGLHSMIVLILFGAFLGSISGFRGMMNIVEGETENLVRLARKDRAIRLPFDVRCDDFEVAFYKDGTPKDYVSRVTILKNNKEVARSEIRVNSPFTYEGITFYQASYGALVKEALVTFIDEKEHREFKLKLTPHNPKPLGESRVMVHLLDFNENFSGFGPALAIALMEPGKKPEGSWILANFPKFHGNRIGRYRVVVDNFKTMFFTGLQVKRDPGVWIVIAGFSGFVVFLMATFYWSYRKVWVTVVLKNPMPEVYIAARTNRNLLSFERDFHNFCSELRRILNSEGVKD